jgi:hypothetical protein
MSLGREYGLFLEVRCTRAKWEPWSLYRVCQTRHPRHARSRELSTSALSKPSFSHCEPHSDSSKGDPNMADKIRTRQSLTLVPSRSPVASRSCMPLTARMPHHGELTFFPSGLDAPPTSCISGRIKSMQLPDSSLARKRVCTFFVFGLSS